MMVDRAKLEQAIQMTSELDTIWNTLECCRNFHVLLDDEAWDEVRTAMSNIHKALDIVQERHRDDG